MDSTPSVIAQTPAPTVVADEAQAAPAEVEDGVARPLNMNDEHDAPAAAAAVDQPPQTVSGGHSPMKRHDDEPPVAAQLVVAHHDRGDSVLQGGEGSVNHSEGATPVVRQPSPPPLEQQVPPPPPVLPAPTTTSSRSGSHSRTTSRTRDSENAGHEGKRSKKSKKDHDAAPAVEERPTEKRDKKDKKRRGGDGDSPVRTEEEPTRGGLSRRRALKSMSGNGGVSPPRQDGGAENGQDVFNLSGVPMAAVQLGDNRLVIHVHHMGTLSPNPDFVHPFIRAWAVDGATGESLALAETGEARCAFTHPFDLRDHESTSPQWEEQLVLELNEPLSEAEEPLLLFELLDFGNVNVRGEPIQRGGALLPIAWGFLNLRDAYGRSNLNRRLHVQLFRSPERRGYARSVILMMKSMVLPTVQSHARFAAQASAADVHKVPPVFRHLMNFVDRNDVYDACLTVNAFLKDDTYTPPDPPLLTFRDQIAMEELFIVLSRVQQGGLAPLPGRSGAISGSFDAEGRARLPARALAAEAERKLKAELLTKDVSRQRNERNLPPKSTLHTIHTRAKVSAIVFSPNAQLLAVGVMADFVASVRLYHLPSPQADVVGELSGHVGHIHEIAFSRDGHFLVTASADRTSRVWDVSSPPVIGVSPLHIFAHGSHVYSAQFLGDTVITAGFEGVLSMWSLSTGALLCTVANAFNACFRSVLIGPLSNSNHKIWTLDSIGFFSAWRAIVDPATNRYTSIEPRRRTQILGATKAYVEGNNALIYVPGENPTLHVLDTVSYTELQVIACGHLPASLRGAAARLPVALLPDAKTAVLALHSSSILAFELGLGELFTSKDGFSVAPGSRVVSQMAWAPTKHISAMALTQMDGPAGCDVVVSVRPRVEGEQCRDTDPQALNVLRHLYGGEITIRPSTVAPGSTSTSHFAHAASLRATGSRGVMLGATSSANLTPRNAPSTLTPRGSRRAPIDIGPNHGPLSQNIETRFNQIISWWKGRVNARGATAPPSRGTALQVDPPNPMDPPVGPLDTTGMLTMQAPVEL